MIWHISEPQSEALTKVTNQLQINKTIKTSVQRLHYNATWSRKLLYIGEIKAFKNSMNAYVTFGDADGCAHLCITWKHIAIQHITIIQQENVCILYCQFDPV